MGFTSSAGCAVTNRKWLSQDVCWSSNWKECFPQFSLQWSVSGLHNKIMSILEEGSLKEERKKGKKIIISHYDLRNILSPQLQNMSDCYKVMCGCECCISANSMNHSLLSKRYFYLKKLKYQSKNNHNIIWGELASNIYETSKML